MNALPRFALLLALALAGTAAAPALAGTLSVTVTGADGRPAADTVVLVRRAGAFQAFDRGAPPVIAQKDIRFSPYVTVVPVRGTVRFVNRDRFDHHVRAMPSGPLSSAPPITDFEFRLAGARGGNEPSAELKLDTAGAIVIGCHLHGSMRAHIYVSPTPFFGVTDAEGKVSIEVPDGAAELALWHPDQIAEQAARPVTIGAATAQPMQLNFSPRRRQAPAAGRADEYRY